MYATNWDVSKGTAPKPITDLVSELEKRFHSVDGELTVSEIRNSITVTFEPFNVSGNKREELFRQAESVAQDTVGVGKYTAWSDGKTLKISE
jgi:uncharacterized tellurite resistance protein B-like protein